MAGFNFETSNGLIRGNMEVVTGSKYCVVLACGHNGFYHFAFFPTIQEGLAKKGISSVAFNFSHCGITDDGDFFNDLDSYQKNCRRLEVEDILAVLDFLKTRSALKDQHICLLGHSMGGYSAGFAASRYIDNSNGQLLLGFLCPLKTLDIRTPEVMAEWKKNGVYYRLNTRTNQELPQGEEFLAETIQSGDQWNLEKAISDYPYPVFVAHSVDDESVPFEHGRSIFSWLYKNNLQNAFLPIPGANHTLNTAHPMKRDSEELQFFIENFSNWLHQLK